MQIKLNGEKMIAAAIMLLIIYLCLPISMIVLGSFSIRLIAFFSAFFFLFALLLMRKWDYLLIITALMMILFLYWRTAWHVKIQSYYYVAYCFFCLIFVFGGMALSSSNDHRAVKCLFLFATLVVALTSITTIWGLRIYPLAAREIARGSTYNTDLDFTEYKQIYRKMNIAGWSQIYGMLFCIPPAFMLWRRKKRAFYAVMAILIFAMIVFSQITFAVLLSVLFFVDFIFCKGNDRKAVFLRLLFLLLAIVLIINIDSILSAAISLFQENEFEYLSTKLSDLRELLLAKDAVGDAEARGALYRTSLDSFLSSPFWGLAFAQNDTSELLGFHSEFFDMLGALGIIGFMAIIASLFAFYRFLKEIKKDYRQILFIDYAGFVILFVLNPVFHSPQIFFGAFFYPLIACRYASFQEQETKKLIF